MNAKSSFNPWPISIIGFFVVAITFIVTFVAWAVRQNEDLVAADYYEREVRFQAQLDTLNRSHAMALQSIVTFEPNAGEIVINLPREKAQDALGTIELYRPSDARLDRQVPLAVNSEGVQRLDARPLRGGLWKIRVKWTAAGQEYFLEQPVIVTSS